MSMGGMSIGGPGGITPGKSGLEKSLSELGPAKESEATQFKTTLDSTQSQASNANLNKEVPGPFDSQVHGVASHKLEKSGTGKTGKGKQGIEKKAYKSTKPPVHEVSGRSLDKHGHGAGHGKPGIVKDMLEYGNKLNTLQVNQKHEISVILKDMKQGFTQAKAIQLQVVAAEMQTMFDAVSKAAGKLVTGIQTVIKGQ